MAFHNPYHFVPVKKVKKDGIKRDSETKNFDFSSHPHVTHDRYVKDTYSGRIYCQLTAETPFVVGDKHNPDENKINPTEVEQYKIDDFPAIPASTLRGLISSIVETASNSSLRVLEDETYSFRQTMKESLSAIGMIVEKDDGLFLRPLTLPNLEVKKNDAAKLSNKFISYKSYFQTPNFKVYFGNFSSIRKETFQFSSFTNETKEYFGLRLKKWKWKNNEIVSANGENNEGFLYWKTGKRTDFILGQCALNKDEEWLDVSEKNIIPWEQVKDNKTYVRGILRVLGCLKNRKKNIPNGKKHEIFIPYTKDMEKWQIFPISEEVIKNFEKMAETQTIISEKSAKNNYELLPYHLKGTTRNSNPKLFRKNIKLKDGDLVFFQLNDQGQISKVSFSSIWRDLVGKVDEESNIKKPDTTYDFFRKNDKKELLPFNRDRDQITIAEQIFGFVENNGELKNLKGEMSLAGRIFPSAAKFEGVQNTDGTWQEIITDDDCYQINPDKKEGGWTLLKVLASPKPPSPALYFRDGYIAKNQLNAEQHQPQGRKFYLHHKNYKERPWESHPDSEKDDKRNLKMLVKPVKKDSVFSFYVDFENLNPHELGALLYAINPNSEFQHKIGLGKSIGLGSIKIEVSKVLTVNRGKRYSSDGLFGERFTENKPELINKLRADFREINPSICGILETIGNPEKVIERVHYPTRNKKSDEGENFKWFVENDKNRKRNLSPIIESRVLPVLDEY